MRCSADLRGSSKDDRDMVAAIIAEQGTVLVHGIAISPGKPTIIGQCGGKPVIGPAGSSGLGFHRAHRNRQAPDYCNDR